MNTIDHENNRDPEAGFRFQIDVPGRNVRFGIAGLVLLILVGAGPAFAQDAQEKELPEKEVSATVSEAATEEALVGPYKQPEWTATHQRFGTTRAYVLPENVYEFEQFVELEHGREDGGPAYELLSELKIGLPWRFQLDLYWTQARGSDDDSFHAGEHKVELRWALANWGEIPLNPTLYAEWETALTEDEDGMEYKLLLAETLGEKWHWAGNLIFEDALSEDEIEYGISSGLNYNLIDQTLGVGIEGEWIREDEGGEDPEDSFLLGPSVDFSPTERTSLRVAPLVGLGGHSPELKTFFIFGYEFGSGVEAKKGARGGTTTSEVR